MLAYRQPSSSRKLSSSSSIDPPPLTYVPASRDGAISVSTFGSIKSTKSMFAKSPVVTPRSSFTSVDSETSAKKFRFDAAPKLVKTPWEADRAKTPGSYFLRQDLVGARPSTSKSTKSTVANTRVFKNVPGEVYECILQHLESMHINTKHGACVSCFHMDLYNLCLTSKAWNARARKILYRVLRLVVDESPSKLHSGPPFQQWKSLRRTLRDNPSLSWAVKEIRAPGLQQLYLRSTIDDKSMILSTLASLVMACTNLEKFTGLYLDFDHDYDRLTHALSTRSKLKEKVWVLKGIEDGWDPKGTYLTNARPIRSDGSIDNGDSFLNCHLRWNSLTTLQIFGQDSGNLDYRAFVGTFRAVPSLKHLLIANFSSTQFNDRTVAALPRNLHSLRLQDLPGLTEKGLYRFIDSAVVISLRSLSLINIELRSAAHLARLFSFTPYLKRFYLSQSISPGIDPSFIRAGAVYHSASLEFLHWDCSPFSQPSLSHLATSIRSNWFPSLTRLRCPCDDGTLQALCRPRAQIARPGDADTQSILTLRSSLGTARMAAQERLEMKRMEPLMSVVVTDEDGLVCNSYVIRNYLGDIKSRVHYVLESDVDLPYGTSSGSHVDSSGIVEVEHLVNARKAVVEDDGLRGAGGARKIDKASMCRGVHGNGWVGQQGFQEAGGKGHLARDRIREVTTDMFF